MNYPVKYRDYFISQPGLNHPIQIFKDYNKLSSNKDPEKPELNQDFVVPRHGCAQVETIKRLGGDPKHPFPPEEELTKTEVEWSFTRN